MAGKAQKRLATRPAVVLRLSGTRLIAELKSGREPLIRDQIERHRGPERTVSRAWAQGRLQRYAVGRQSNHAVRRLLLIENKLCIQRFILGLLVRYTGVIQRCFTVRHRWPRFCR